MNEMVRDFKKWVFFFVGIMMINWKLKRYFGTLGLDIEITSFKKIENE